MKRSQWNSVREAIVHLGGLVIMLMVVMETNKRIKPPPLSNFLRDQDDKQVFKLMRPKAWCLPFLVELIPGNENCHLKRTLRSRTPISVEYFNYPVKC